MLMQRSLLFNAPPFLPSLLVYSSYPDDMARYHTAGCVGM